MKKKKRSSQKCLGEAPACTKVSFVTCNTSQPAATVMIDILMDPLAWAARAFWDSLDTICCSHFNAHDRCEKPFLSKHQEGLSKLLVQHSKIRDQKFWNCIPTTDWHSISSFVLPFRLGRAEMKPRRKLDLLTCQGKNFCALLFSSRFLSSLHSLPFQSPLVSTVFSRKRWYLRFLPHCYSRINSVCSPNHYLLGCRGCRWRTLFVSFLVLSFPVFAK